MSFASDSGYTPVTIDAIMLAIMTNINTQFGTGYTVDTFVGSNFYKYFYALAQRLQENEIKTSEIFTYLQQYFVLTNESISRPAVTNPGLIETLNAAGYVASIKPMVDADAGKIHVCVNVDSGAGGYAATKLAICTIIKDSTVAGTVTQGTETQSITLTNGQAFTFKYELPNKIPVLLKITTVLSDNNLVVISSPEDQKQKLFDNIAARYALGEDFEPQRYLSVTDCPWASSVLLQWSSDAGSTYHSTVFDANYNDLYTFSLGDISLVET